TTGSIDASFGTAGTWRGNGVTSEVYGGALDGADGIVIAAHGGGAMRLVRLDRSGMPRSSFNGNGIANIAIPSLASIHQVVVDDQDRIVAVGAASGDVLIARVLPDGGLDPTFGTNNGWQRYTIAGGNEVGRSVQVLGDGRI